MKPIRQAARSLALIAVLLAPSPSAAQQLIDMVPRREFTDQNGVDMSGPTHRFREPLLAIGGGSRPLGLQLSLVSPGSLANPCFADVGSHIYWGLNSNSYFRMTGNGIAWHTAVLPHQAGRFWVAGNPVTVSSDSPGATGSYDPTYTYFSYVGRDGTQATFSSVHIPWRDVVGSDYYGAVDQITFPDGEVWTYRYNDVLLNASSGCSGRASRLRSIVSNRGYALQFDYSVNPGGTITAPADLAAFMSITRVTAYNKASVYCDETLLQSCASVTALPSAVTFSYDETALTATITKANGETVQLGFTHGNTLNLTSITRPGMSRTMTYEDHVDQDYGPYSYIYSVTEAGRTWYYSMGLTVPGSWDTWRAEPSQTGPGALGTYYRVSGGFPFEIYDPHYNLTRVGYNANGEQTFYGAPEGNEVQSQQDARGNTIWVRRTPKTGTGYLQANATFPSTCTSTDRRTCNQPTSQSDFNGNTTDYTYDTAHGGLLTETGPAVNSIRPQTRHTYEQRYAWVSNGSGGYAQAATPVWLRTSTSACRTSAATGNPSAPCATTGDEVLTAYDYGPTGSGPNTLLLRGQTVTATDGGVTTTLRTCYGYDANGNRISETQPNANLTSCP